MTSRDFKDVAAANQCIRRLANDLAEALDALQAAYNGSPGWGNDVLRVLTKHGRKPEQEEY